MPTYDYECQSCSHRFSAKQRMSDAPLDTCPQCEGSVRRLLSAGAVIVKGGGGPACSVNPDFDCSSCCPDGGCRL